MSVFICPLAAYIRLACNQPCLLSFIICASPNCAGLHCIYSCSDTRFHIFKSLYSKSVTHPSTFGKSFINPKANHQLYIPTFFLVFFFPLPITVHYHRLLDQKPRTYNQAISINLLTRTQRRRALIDYIISNHRFYNLSVTWESINLLPWGQLTAHSQRSLVLPSSWFDRTEHLSQ